MNVLIPVLCALVGALVYVFAAPRPPRPVAELARLLFLAAVIALMFAFANRSVHFF